MASSNKYDSAEVFSIAKLTEENTDFRRVLSTAQHSQLVLMCLKPNEEIGEEVHDVDQMLFIANGKGISVLSGEKHDIGSGDVVFVPSGTLHNIANTEATQSMTLFTVYAPAEHAPGTIHRTKAEAEADENH